MMIERAKGAREIREQKREKGKIMPSRPTQIKIHVIAMGIELVRIHRVNFRFHYAGIMRAVWGI